MKWLTRKGSNKKTHRLDKPGLVLSLEALSPLDTVCTGNGFESQFGLHIRL